MLRPRKKPEQRRKSVDDHERDEPLTRAWLPVRNFLLIVSAYGAFSTGTTLVVLAWIGWSRDRYPSRLCHPRTFCAQVLRLDPTIGGWQLTRTPSLLVTAMALVALVATANLVYERCHRLLAASLPLMTAATSILLVLEFRGLAPAPASAQAPAPAPAPAPTQAPGHGALTWAVAAGVAVLVIKIFMLHRYAYEQSRVRQRRSKRPRLLPARVKDVDELGRLVTEERDHGRVIPIVGRWGEGKTFLLDSLEDRWDRPGKPTLVVVDIWKSESERDLQIEIIRALLSHPYTRRRWRWLTVPVGFAFSGILTTIRTLKVKLTEPKSKTAAEAEVNLPALTWQRLFERLTRFNRNGTVIALDELDRASSPVTQAAVTLVKRSATLPGVTILISYTGDLIRYKVFNPLLPTLPDLASTMEAVLYEEFSDRLPALTTSEGDSATEALDAAAKASDVATKALEGVTKTSGQPTPTAETSDLTTETVALATTTVALAAETVSLTRLGAGDPPVLLPTPWRDVTASGSIGELLLSLFAAEPLARRQRLQARFEEKYLGSTQLTVHRLTADDLKTIFTVFPTPARHAADLLGVTATDFHDRRPGKISEILRRATGSSGRTPEKATAFLERLGSGAEILAQRPGFRDSVWRGGYPPTRVLNRTTNRVLDAAKNQAEPGSLSADLVAALTLMALDLAIRIYTYTPESTSGEA